MTLIQYIIVRSDLIKKLNWPLGAVITQCCHAVAAINHLSQADEDSIKYLEDLDNMHKCVLQIEDDTSLVALGETLTANNIKFKLWVEQPENIPTCIALKAYEKETVQGFVKKLKLFK